MGEILYHNFLYVLLRKKESSIVEQELQSPENKSDGASVAAETQNDENASLNSTDFIRVLVFELLFSVLDIFNDFFLGYSLFTSPKKRQYGIMAFVIG